MNGILKAGSTALVAADQPWSALAAATTTFTRNSLGKVCTLVRSAGLRAGLAPRTIEDLLISVSEIATNAIRYGGGSGLISVRRLTQDLLTEIRDSGPGLPEPLASGHLPADGGLWRARTLCRRFDVVSSAHGVTVRIFTPYGS